MRKDTRIKLRIDADKKQAFKKKAKEGYGGMSEFLTRQIDSFLAEEPIGNDTELTDLLYAVRALGLYTNNVNQIAKKLNSGEYPKINPSELMEIQELTFDVILKFRACLEARKDTFS